MSAISRLFKYIYQFPSLWTLQLSHVFSLSMIPSVNILLPRNCHWVILSAREIPLSKDIVILPFLWLLRFFFHLTSFYQDLWSWEVDLINLFAVTRDHNFRLITDSSRSQVSKSTLHYNRLAQIILKKLLGEDFLFYCWITFPSIQKKASVKKIYWNDMKII